jgi:mediator of RNA polymerase II transcription subunit 13
LRRNVPVFVPKTDLKGIKWSKMRLKDQYNEVKEYLDDPILQTYSKCLNEDLLCAWKRINKANLKELWLFWYDKEPAAMRGLIAPELVEYECGSWEKQEANGLSYECRIVLFKALHNRIEKCLVQKDFARLGKWFVQPYKHVLCNNLFDSNNSGLNHVSYSFNFFLHGASKICTSVDVKIHKPIRCISKYDLLDLNGPSSSTATKLGVILSPFGLNGTLIGFLNNDSETGKKSYDEWKRFYSIRSSDDATLPRMLVILIGRCRLGRPCRITCHLNDFPCLKATITAFFTRHRTCTCKCPMRSAIRRPTVH